MANIDWDAVFDAAGKKYNIDPRVLKRLGGHESGNNPNSRPGPQSQYASERAIGQMQVLPSTGRGLGYDVHDPIQNVFAGAAYMREGLDNTGNIADAIRYYHGGPNRQIWGREGEKEVQAVLGDYRNIQIRSGGDQPQGTVDDVAQRRMPWEEPYDRSHPAHQDAKKMPWEEEPAASSSEDNDASLREFLKRREKPVETTQPAPTPTTTAPEAPAPEAPAPEAPAPAAASPESEAPLPNTPAVINRPAAPVQQPTNPLQAAITGAANGALFGYGPQVVGSVQSVNPFTRETYSEARDRAQARIQAAQDQHPYAYSAGDVAGNMLTAAVPFAGEGAFAGKLASAGVRYMPKTAARAVIGGAEGALNSSSDPNASLGSVATGAATGAVGSSIAPPILQSAGNGLSSAIDNTTGRLMTYIGRGSRNAGVAASTAPAVAGAGVASGLLGSIPIVGPLGEIVGASPLVGQVIAPAIGGAAAVDVGGRLAAAALKNANTTGGRAALNAIGERGPQDVSMLREKAKGIERQSTALDGLYDRNLAIQAKKLFASTVKVSAIDVADLLRNADPHDEQAIRKAFSDRIDQVSRR